MNHNLPNPTRFIVESETSIKFVTIEFIMIIPNLKPLQSYATGLKPPPNPNLSTIHSTQPAQLSSLCVISQVFLFLPGSLFNQPFIFQKTTTKWPVCDVHTVD